MANAWTNFIRIEARPAAVPAAVAQEEPQTNTVQESQELPTRVAEVAVVVQMLGRQPAIPIIIVHRVLILNIEEVKAAQE